MRPRLGYVMSALALTLAAVTGCGGDDGDDTGTDPGSGVITIKEGDETITVEPGTEPESTEVTVAKAWLVITPRGAGDEGLNTVKAHCDVVEPGAECTGTEVCSKVNGYTNPTCWPRDGSTLRAVCDDRYGVAVLLTDSDGRDQLQPSRTGDVAAYTNAGDRPVGYVSGRHGELAEPTHSLDLPSCDDVLHSDYLHERHVAEGRG